VVPSHGASRIRIKGNSARLTRTAGWSGNTRAIPDGNSNVLRPLATDQRRKNNHQKHEPYPAQGHGQKLTSKVVEIVSHRCGGSSGGCHGSHESLTCLPDRTCGQRLKLMISDPCADKVLVQANCVLAFLRACLGRQRKGTGKPACFFSVALVSTCNNFGTAFNEAYSTLSCQTLD
jgi:hypothetical protein